MIVLLVALGCALGGVLRFLTMTAVARFCGEGFPYGTLAVNMAGSALLGGVLFAAAGTDSAGPLVEPAFVFWGIGLCGGLTTFSTFSLQTLSLVSQQAWKRVAFNIGGSLVLCLLCLIGGYRLAEGLAV